MKMAKKAMKKQFNKKRQNPQELKKGDNMWLKIKNIYLNQSSKNIRQEVF